MRSGEYFVYILYSEKLGKYYIGHTNNLERRLFEHNIGHEKYTRSGLPWKVMYSKIYSDKKEALGEEMRIKKRKSRKYILKLISEG
jgi:putative endonuclease